jgi:hypothetical protein
VWRKRRSTCRRPQQQRLAASTSFRLRWQASRERVEPWGGDSPPWCDSSVTERVATCKETGCIHAPLLNNHHLLRQPLQAARQLRSCSNKAVPSESLLSTFGNNREREQKELRTASEPGRDQGGLSWASTMPSAPGVPGTRLPGPFVYRCSLRRSTSTPASKCSTGGERGAPALL